ncbi:MAG: Sir2 family NAD-dependent protein deacetylase [Armatimonadota bacterium]
MKIVALTGAGISRESDLKTFRDEDGLWEGYSIEDVCTPRAFAQHPQRVLDFYNYRRQEVAKSVPNAAHLALAELAQKHEVRIITQNIDDLHERGGSSEVLHIHGEIFKARSVSDFDVQQEIRHNINVGDLAADGHQLRPHICFFEETPYDWETAIQFAEDADIFVVIGTSLTVYPAAGLLDISRAKRRILIDPKPNSRGRGGIEVIAERATVGVPRLVAELLG